MSIEIRICKIHGETTHVKNPSHPAFRCRKCNVERVQRRRDQLKIKAVEYMGGGCALCGYNKCIGALEFHHKNPREKDFGIGSKGYTRSWEKVKAELDKCIMLCANCHREVHAGVAEQVDATDLKSVD